MITGSTGSTTLPKRVIAAAVNRKIGVSRQGEPEQLLNEKHRSVYYP